MLKTNYSKVSKVYDQNKGRLNFPKDEDIEKLLEKNEQITVLDLACGTGNYLLSQQEYYKDKNIRWIGIDLSMDMLNMAKSKNLTAEFINSDAESYNLEEESVDLVVCNFAFHHFENKQKCLGKIYATLKKGGILRFRNIEPECMKDWWVYKYCLETFYEDMHRFWPKDLMMYELKKNNFKNITAKREYYEKSKPISELVENYKRRDTSQLAMIGDEMYDKGMKRVMQEVNQGESEYKDVTALLEIRCEKN
ncbi:MAG: methyltransferase domain-containing protein [Treponema sp.]|nr:methyltransferase domain-containing protein [Treponema sp.]